MARPYKPSVVIPGDFSSENLQRMREFATRNPKMFNKQLNRIAPDEYRGTRKLANMLIQQYPDRFPNATADQVVDMMQKIAKVETGDKNIPQAKGGPGRGNFQIETTTAPTALKRYQNYQDILSPLSAVPLPKIKPTVGRTVIKDGEQVPTASVMNLPKDQQAMLALSNIATNAKDKGVVDVNKPMDAWLNYHWAGSPSQRDERIAHWEDTFKAIQANPQAHEHGGWVYPTNTNYARVSPNPVYRKGGYILPGHTYPTYADGGVTFSSGGEKHRVYIKESPTGLGKGVEGHVMVNHPTMDKGNWDTIDLTEKAGAKTVAQGVAATKKWHRENPEYAKGGWTGYPDHTMYSSGMERFDRVRKYTKYKKGGSVTWDLID